MIHNEVKLVKDQLNYIIFFAFELKISILDIFLVIKHE